MPNSDIRCRKEESNHSSVIIGVNMRYVNDGNWAVFAEKVVAERDDAREQIYRLKQQIQQMTAALTAGPLRLREMSADFDRIAKQTGNVEAVLRAADLRNHALHVEAAQEKAMKCVED